MTYLNYDFRFDKEDTNSWGMRVGAGGWATGRTSDSERFLTIPIQFSKLMSTSRHFFEYGGGAAILYFRDIDSSSGSESIYKDYNFFLDMDNTPSFIGRLALGYRYIPKENGLTFHANISPFFNHTGFWLLFG